MVNTKMTVIADKIRTLLGITAKMGLDAMAAHLGTEQTNIENAFSAVGNKGGNVPSSKTSGNLASAINSIPTGVSVQTHTGTFTTNYQGSASVSGLGFKPDFVAIDGGTSMAGSSSGIPIFNGAAFTAGGVNKSTMMIAPPEYSQHMLTGIIVTQSNNGFSVTAKNVAADFTESACANRTIRYVAVKYT